MKALRKQFAEVPVPTAEPTEVLRQRDIALLKVPLVEMIRVHDPNGGKAILWDGLAKISPLGPTFNGKIQGDAERVCPIQNACRDVVMAAKEKVFPIGQSSRSEFGSPRLKLEEQIPLNRIVFMRGQPFSNSHERWRKRMSSFADTAEPQVFAGFNFKPRVSVFGGCLQGRPIVANTLSYRRTTIGAHTTRDHALKPRGRASSYRTKVVKSTGRAPGLEAAVAPADNPASAQK